MQKRFALSLLAGFMLSPAFAAVDLNTASKEELDAVKWITPAKAQAIVDYRKEHGPFKSVDDLKHVKGFGDKSIAKLSGELTVGGALAAKDGAAAKKR